MLLCNISASAHSFEVGGILYSTTPSGVTVTYKGGSALSAAYKGDIVIPSSVEYDGSTYSVTSIGDYAFYGCSGLTSITIPNSVTSIGDFAFNACSGLTSITIPNSVTSIGDYAFCGCTGLTSITIPNSVTSIGNMAYQYCFNLTSITIPNSVTSIGDEAFGYCSGLASITIGNNVTSIGLNAFRNCTGLTSITIPNSVTNIGSSAFEGCSGLTSITIPNSVTSIGSSAFKGCSGLTSITIPNSVTSIGYDAFYGCSGLTSICVDEGNTVYDSRENCNAIIQTETNELIAGCQSTIIPNSVKRIGNSAFYGCNGLTSITIPNSVTNIGSSAFEGCSGLTSITIPNSVTSIGFYVFRGCSGLTSICVDEGNTVYDSRENCNAIIQTETNELIAGCQSTIIPNSVTSIGSYAFYGCSSLTSITIGNSVTSIGYYAFYGCSNLSNFTINNSTPFAVSTMYYFSSSATLTVPNGSAKAYSDMGGFWGQFAAIKEEANVNISEENMWSTCVLAFDAELPEGVRAFISTGMDENSVLMEEVTTLEAYKPYVLYAQNGYEGTLTGVVDLTAYQETVTDGVLSGAIVKQEASSGYILQNQGQGSKFYNMNGQTFTIPAGKCWLSAFDAGASSVTMRFTGGVTGIEGVYMERPTGVEGADMLYDLEGRRVENPLPGRVYIKGGKKVMLKNREF